MRLVSVRLLIIIKRGNSLGSFEQDPIYVLFRTFYFASKMFTVNVQNQIELSVSMA